MRFNDVVIRYGGEEFVILMPDTYKEGAIGFGERIQDALRERIFDRKEKRIKLKVRYGHFRIPRRRDMIPPAGLLDSADKALREAKEQGGREAFSFQNVSGREIKDIIKTAARIMLRSLKSGLPI